MPHSRWHDSFIFATWRRASRAHQGDMTLSYLRHDSFIHATWLIQFSTWLIYMCDMYIYIGSTWAFQRGFQRAVGLNCVYTWHNSFIHVTWLIYACDMRHLHIWHEKLVRYCLYMTMLIIFVTWHVADYSSSTWLVYSFIRVTWLVQLFDMTRCWLYVWAQHVADYTCEHSTLLIIRVSD